MGYWRGGRGLPNNEPNCSSKSGIGGLYLHGVDTKVVSFFSAETGEPQTSKRDPSFLLVTHCRPQGQGRDFDDPRHPSEDTTVELKSISWPSRLHNADGALSYRGDGTEMDGHEFGPALTVKGTSWRGHRTTHLFLKASPAIARSTRPASEGRRPGCRNLS